jgi:hypothetical protein
MGLGDLARQIGRVDSCFLDPRGLTFAPRFFRTPFGRDHVGSLADRRGVAARLAATAASSPEEISRSVQVDPAILVEGHDGEGFSIDDRLTFCKTVLHSSCQTRRKGDVAGP